MNWCQTEKNELEICWNKLKCNFFKNHSHLDSKRQKEQYPYNSIFFIIFMCLQRWIWINLKLMNWCQTERMNLEYVEINWNVIFSKIILILIRKGKRAVPVQLYIFIIFMCLQRWIWINLKLMNWCQTERMNLKYVEINWNVIFSKIILILIRKRQKSITRTTLYFYHFYVSTKVNMNKFETNELMSNWKNELEICWNKLKCNFFKNHSHLDSKRQKSSTRTTLYFYHFYVSTKVNMNKFETNELMSNWRNELEICWNKLKCNFFQKSFSSWF